MSLIIINTSFTTLENSVNVKLVEKLKQELKMLLVKIEGSLWKPLDDQGIDAGIIDLMEEALSSSVDFYHARKNDTYKIIFERKYIDGNPVGIGKLLAAEYTNDSSENYSIYYKSNDQEVTLIWKADLLKSFLKSPVNIPKFLQDSV